MTRKILTAFACVAFSATGLSQEPHEKPPILKASEILKPEFLAGPLHKVRESVPTHSGANRFVITSDFGVFEADGNALLETRVVEIGAIEKLRQMSRSDEYKKALERAAKSPIVFAENLAKDPLKTVGDVPKGAWKLLNRVGEGVKGAVDGNSGSAEDAATSAIGMQAAKRQLAAELGVDPYSTNPALQQELNSVAWASFAGGTTIKVLMLPLSGGVVTAVKLASTGSEVQQVLRESSPTDLRTINRDKLLAMEVPKDVVESFLANAALSPSHQTVLVAALARLEGVKGRGDFVRGAARLAEDEQDAIFWDLTARMIADVHARRKLDRLSLLERTFPVSVAQDGTVVVALHWDYACWTPLADKFTRAVQKLGTGEKPPCLLALSGVVSPRLRSELESRGFKVEDRLVPGPLR
jgi:hypothetical protein